MLIAAPSLLAEETERDPYAFYEYLREHAPVHFDPDTGAYLLTRHADVSSAYRHPAFTTENYGWQLEPVMGRTILQMTGHEHSAIRGVMSPYFRGDGLKSWLPLIQRTVAQLLESSARARIGGLIDRLEVGQEVDLTTELIHLFPVHVIADVLGLPQADYPLFYGFYLAQSAFLSNLSHDPEVHRRGEVALQEMQDYLRPMVVARRADPGADFISMLASAQVDGRQLADEEVMTHATHLLNAGSETTDRTLTNLLTHTLSRPELYAALRDDRSLVLPAISETLRFTPPSQMNGRITSEDVEFHGTVIPAGSFVMLVMASANRDERRFKNADTFDLYRDDLSHEKAFSSAGEHFAFGYGRHFCLGALVARAELEIGLNALLDAFPAMRLAPGFTPAERGLKMRSPYGLRVVL